MNASTPFRHVREIVGVFVLGALGLVLLALLFIGRGQHWFDRRADLDATFPSEHAAVLRPGVPVRLAGDVVGRVVATTRGKDRIRAVLTIHGSARDVLREDARATLRVPIAGLVGELGIELDAGGAAAPWPEGKLLEGEAEGDPAVRAREMVEAFREQVPAMMARTQAILDKTDAILGQVRDSRAPENADRLIRSIDRLARAVEREETVAHASRVLAEAEALLKAARQGGGTAQKLLTDPALYDRSAAVLADLHGSWEKVDALVGASTRVAERASELAEVARGRTAELEALLGQVQLLVLQANRALDLVNEHWLLRGAAPEPGRPAPLGVIDVEWGGGAPAPGAARGPATAPTASTPGATP
jgi:ABC-type transporter Mla subunit MlaD